MTIEMPKVGAHVFKAATELRDIEKITPYIRNPMKHSRDSIDKLAGAIAEWGFDVPIVVDGQGVIIKGHRRRLAALKLGMKEVPVIVRTDLTPEQVKAARIADNQLPDDNWDIELLAVEMRDLRLADFDLKLTGFDEAELAQLGLEDPPPDETDADAIPEKVETRCKPGDLWVLGKHRLLCGDSTNVQHVERLMGGEKADMVFTDPPYGISIVKGGTVGAPAKVGFVSPRNAPAQLARAREYRAIEGDDQPFDPSLILAMGIKTVILWGANHYASRLPDRPQWLIWDKKLESGSLDHNNFSDCELAWTNSAGLSAKIYRHTWAGMLRAGERADELKDRVHPTQKPVGLCVAVIGDFSSDGDSVLDLFLGSGSTLIACEKTARRCFGMEIDPHYCSVILKRWEDFSGKQAVLLESAPPLQNDLPSAPA